MIKKSSQGTIHPQKSSFNNKKHLLIIGGLFLTLFICVAGYDNLQKNYSSQYPWLNFSNFLQSFKTKEKQQLLSPIDQQPLQHRYQLISNVYFDMYSGPVDMFYEEYVNKLQTVSEPRGRIVIYSKRNDENSVIAEENNSACLDAVMPISKGQAIRFVTSYHCGDSKQFKITSLLYENSAKNTEKIKSSEDYYLLSTYFQYNYSSADVKVLGWLNFNNLLVDQIYSSEENSSREEKHEIYIFNVNNKTKELIHTFYQ